jgi:hypothetical protein
MMMVASVSLPDTTTDTSLAQRLSTEFDLLPRRAVERCISDVSACVEHLGVHATPDLVERIARAHLVGMVMSEPPSGRPG